VVDYLQLISAAGRGGENRQQEISTISRQLKALAREMSVPLIALSQLSRQVESREGKRPVLADLRESGAIEQDADVVAFIYRPELVGQKEIEIHGSKYDSTGISQIIIAKQRNGPIGDVYLTFKKEWVSFENMKLETMEPYIPETQYVDEDSYGGTG